MDESGEAMTSMCSRSRTAVVTGAGSAKGIGRATAHELVLRGWSVALLDRDADGVEVAAQELCTAGHEARAIAVDLTDQHALAAAVRQIEEELPPVAGLVNNAGVTHPGRFAETSLEQWREMFRINVESQFLTTQAFLPQMIDRGVGRVVAVSSAAAQRGGGYFGGVHYSASKAAILGMVKALAREHVRSGVTFNVVTPGAIATDITAGAMSGARQRAVEESTPVGRLGRPDEVAAVIAFLCSDEAAFITGATYDVNGGSHIH